jgi:uncharacterized protein YjbI with pentapeptide repeats
MPVPARPVSLPVSRPDALPEGLRADCGSCFGLCCVVPAFSASADFAVTKPAGRPCPNLGEDFGCGIHTQLRPRGFAGCTVYDCFGAGQKVSTITFGGRDWRGTPELADQMFAVFPIVRQLQEVLRYLAEALTLEPAAGLRPELAQAYAETEQLTLADPGRLLSLDLAAHREQANQLLRRASGLARSVRPHPASARPRGRARLRAGVDRAGADLIGADLSGADLQAASLRGALLIGANLTGADLRLADVTGADLRGADLSGADLSSTLFLVQPQLDAATGDPSTRLPSRLTRPAHWPQPPSQPQPPLLSP